MLRAHITKLSVMALTLAALTALVSLLTGCATVSSTPDGYSVRGITANPEAAIAVAGDNHLRQQQLKECWQAYRAGDVLACPGSYDANGANGNGDAAFYYGGLVPAPGSGLIPYQGSSQPGTVGTARDEVARRTAKEAKEMAKDSIRVNKRVLRKLTGQGR